MASKEISASTTRTHKRFQPITGEFTHSYARGAGRKKSDASDWRATLMEGVSGRLGADVGSGWRHLLESAFDILRRHGWDGSNLVSIRSKNAGLVLTFAGKKVPIQEMVKQNVLVASFRTCCRCGDGGGYLTFRGLRSEILCVKCHNHVYHEDPDGKHAAHSIQS